MPIKSTEVVFLESKNMNDNEDGGGEMTARVITSGESGNVWPDISRLDRTTGGVEMRKLYLAIVAANSDVYSGAHAIIDRPAEDPRVNMFLMNLNDHYDNRQDARNSVESFIVKAGRSPLQLNGAHLKDQTDLSCWMQLDADEPKIGDTIVLIQDDDESQEQYVRIKSLSIETKTFTYLNGQAYAKFTAKAVQIGLSVGLDQNFSAAQASPIVTNATTLLKTQPAPGVEYFSARPLVGTAVLGETSIKVDAIQQQLLPVATTENPMIDLPVSNGVRIRPIAGLTVTVDISTAAGDTGVWFLPRPPAPGTLELTLNGSRYHEVAGEFTRDSGTEYFNEVVTIDHATRQIKYSAKGSYTGTLSFTPSQNDIAPVFTQASEVTSLTRGTNWTFNLTPLPAPGSVVVRYLYSGDWVKLSDNGTGQLAGPGTGSVNYETGSVLAATAALPELSSSILISWSEADYPSAPLAAAGPAELYFVMAGVMDAGPASINWTVAGAAKTISRPDSATPWTGDGVARVVYGEQSTEIYFSPDALSDAADYQVTCNHFTALATTVSKPLSVATINPTGAASLALDLGLAVADQSVRFDIKMVKTDVNEYHVRGGSGLIQVKTSNIHRFVSISFYQRDALIYSQAGNSAQQVGTVDVATGQVAIDLTKFKHNSARRVLKQDENLVWQEQSKTVSVARMGVPAQTPAVFYVETTALVTPITDPISPAFIAPFAVSDTIPGTAVFQVGSDVYFDNDLGQVLGNYSTTTDAAEVVGSMVYRGDEVFVSMDVPELSSLQVTPLGALERTGEESPPQLQAYFYLPKAPIRPGTVQIVFDEPEGDKITLHADSAGQLFEYDRIFSGHTMAASIPPNPTISIAGNSYVYGSARSGEVINDLNSYGKIDYETGQIIINFKESVATELVTVNAVQTVSVPLDADLIGLDSVRMPSNGLVPIFKPGNVLVIHHTDALAAASLSAGQVLDTSRTELASLVIVDSLGVALDPTQYTADLAAGTATLATPLIVQDITATALTAPFEAIHRVETMALCNDTSLDGTLGLALPLDRDIPAGAIVSSAIALGDIQARVNNLFSQSTDVTGQFPDAITSDPTNARVNDLDYPIVMDSRGAVKEKWKIKFKSTTAFDVYSERRGSVISGAISEDLSPVNPVSGVPYFTLKAEAWGVSGWNTGNIVRFDTDPAAAPVWSIRSIQPGPTSLEVDSFSLQARGDTDQ